MRKIAILGGAFDPPHKAHQRIVQIIRETYGFDLILIVPTAISPHKPNTATELEHRLKLLELFVQNEAKCELVKFEVERSVISYTINTVEYLKQLYPNDELVYILGADNYFIFHTWKEYKKLASLIHFMVINRDEYNSDDYLNYFSEHLADLNPDSFAFIQIKPIEISSTKIRLGYKQKFDQSQMVPDYINRYILENGVYK